MASVYTAESSADPNYNASSFLRLLQHSGGVDVLVITGMRERSVREGEGGGGGRYGWLARRPVLTVLVRAGDTTRSRRGWVPGAIDAHPTEAALDEVDVASWDMVLDNDDDGEEAVRLWTTAALLPRLLTSVCPGPGSVTAALAPEPSAGSPFGGALVPAAGGPRGLEQLRVMVRSKPGFPRPGIVFREVAGLVEQRGGLRLCTELLRDHISAALQQQAAAGLAWEDVDAFEACQSGGYLFAAPLAYEMDKPLVRLHKLAGGSAALHRPGPVVTSAYGGSHIDAAAAAATGDGAIGDGSCKGKEAGGGSLKGGSGDRLLLLELGALLPGQRVVLVDDVLASGATMQAALALLRKAGVTCLCIAAVAELAGHGARGGLEGGAGEGKGGEGGPVVALLQYEGF